MRATCAVSRHKRKKKILALTKGFVGRKGKCVNLAISHARRKLLRQYVSRKLIKRDMRSLWIIRINAAAREEGVTYSQLMRNLKGSPLNDRKLLSEIAITNKEEFGKIVKKACL
jgi:large subunit ribosomal protein L20